MNVGAMALALFGGYYRRKRARFSFLGNDLLKARIYVPLEKWLSTATIYSLVLSSFCVTLGLVASAFLFDYVPIWRYLFKVEADLSGILADFGLIILVVVACFLAVFLLFLFFNAPILCQYATTNPENKSDNKTYKEIKGGEDSY